jgi:4,5-DOPA dioxygenase extradiol
MTTSAIPPIPPTRPAASRPASLFVSHGAPTLPLDDVPARAFLRGLGAALPKPRAIVAISAHTVARGVLVGSAPRMHAVHDFGGFPDALYRLRYDAPGDPALATRVAARLREAGIAPLGEATIDGLDHGIWVPLSQMFPEADVPVVVVSLDARMDPAMHVAIGRALRGLDAEGVLVFASGSVTHNLRDVAAGGREIAAAPAPYAVEFTDWVGSRIAPGDTEGLAHWDAAPHARRAHPTAEHFVPLLVAAGTGGAGETLHESFTFGVLGMHAYGFEAAMAD